MAVLSKEEFMSQLSARMGDDNSDETLAFIENMTDTYNSLEANGQGIAVEQANAEWQAKYDKLQADYDTLDTSWREKYKARFFSGEDSQDMQSPTEVLHPENNEVTYDDLFVEKGDN